MICSNFLQRQQQLPVIDDGAVANTYPYLGYKVNLDLETLEFLWIQQWAV